MNDLQQQLPCSYLPTAYLISESSSTSFLKTTTTTSSKPQSLYKEVENYSLLKEERQSQRLSGLLCDFGEAFRPTVCLHIPAVQRNESKDSFSSSSRCRGDEFKATPSRPAWRRDHLSKNPFIHRYIHTSIYTSIHADI